MKYSKLLPVIAFATCFSATVAFAAPEAPNPMRTIDPNNINETKDKKELGDKAHERKEECKDRQKFSKDPVKMLERRKEKIQSLLKEGKISKEQADKITEKIDSKIKEIEEFNRLPLEKKKEKLISNFKNRIDKKVEEGKISKEERDGLLNRFTQKVNQWDGSGYFKFHGREMKHGNKPDKGMKLRKESYKG